MPLVKIDDHEFEVEAGITILEAAKRVGIEIPHYCYHPSLKVVASCRMCLVKVEGFPKLVPSCQTTINNVPEERKVEGKYDMVVSTQHPEVKEAQESVLEFLLLNHPTDCPECDQAGECHLQDYTFKYGRGYSRFDFEKHVPERKDLGPNVLLIATRCIHCTRCIRFTQEVTGTNELIMRNRGMKSEVDTFPGISLNNKLSMNVVDLCPVGAMVSKDFLHKPRNWRYQKVKTVCPGCSLGCNIQIEFMAEDNHIYRIKPVYNQEVNQWWMCDEGRLLYHTFDHMKRLEYPMVRQGNQLNRVSWKEAFTAVVEGLKKFAAEEIAVVVNGYATNEETYLLKKVFSEGLGVSQFALFDKYRKEEDDVFPKFTIKGEKVPNIQGVRDMVGKTITFTTLLKKIQDGKIKALYFVGGDPYANLSEKDLEVLEQLSFLAVQDIQHSGVSERAQVVLAGASPYEKDGTYTNFQGRVQRIRPTVMPPLAARPDYEIVRELGLLLEVGVAVNPRKAFLEIARSVKGYGDMDYALLSETGVPKGEGARVRQARIAEQNPA
jgi:NADH-quinone oxidoreductase subunit G